MSLIAAAASLLLGLAAAERLPDAPFAFEPPAGPHVVRRALDLAKFHAVDFTLKDWGAKKPWKDMIRLEYSDHSDPSVDSGEQYARTFVVGAYEPWGKPQRSMRAGFKVYEGAHRKPDRSQVRLDYIIEFGKNRYMILSLNCSGESFKSYAPVYQKLKESIVLDEEAHGS